MGLTKGGKKIYITKRKTHKINRRGLTKRRRLTKTNKRNRRGRSRRGRGAGQSVNSDGDKNGENKKDRFQGKNSKIKENIYYWCCWR